MSMSQDNMNDEPELPAPEERSSLAADIVARVSSVAIELILQMAILFLAASRFDWT